MRGRTALRAGRRLRPPGGRALGPGELVLEEREHFAERRAPEEHRAPDLVPGVDLPAEVAGGDRVPARPPHRDELSAAIARGQLGDSHQLPAVREVDVGAHALEHRDRPARDRSQLVGAGLLPHETHTRLPRRRRAPRSARLRPPARVNDRLLERPSAASSDPLSRNACPAPGAAPPAGPARPRADALHGRGATPRQPAPAVERADRRREAADRLRRRGLGRRRRLLPARRGSRRPARGGSRRSRRPVSRLWALIEPGRETACSSARSPFGIDAYATSRIRTWLKRKPSSPGRSARSGRTNSFGRGRAVPPRPAPSSSAPTAPRWKSRPSTAACCRTVRSSASRRSMRAARSAWIVGGIDSAPVSIVREHREDLLDEEWVPRPCPRSARARPSRPRGRAGGRRRASSDSAGRAGPGDERRAPARRRPGRPHVEEVCARQTTRIGAPLEKPTRYSSRSSSTGSAQWMSSTTTTSGRLAASVSRGAEGPRGLLGRAEPVAAAGRAGDQPRGHVSPIRRRQDPRELGLARPRPRARRRRAEGTRSPACTATHRPTTRARR